MKFNRLFIFITFFLLLTLVTVAGCQNQSANIKGSGSIGKASEMQEDGNETSEAEVAPAYLQEYEGLHVTGTAIDVDLKTYRLEITGEVNKNLSLTFDDVKNLPSVRIYSELDCPGFFIDKGYWTGVKILDLLNMAGLKENAKEVEFISVDGSYSKVLALEDIQPEGFLIAYQFNDKEFSKYHGFPLRVVAKDQPGSVWVKWLGKIEVLAG